MNAKRQHSVPYLEQEVRLHSEHAQHAFRRMFSRVSRALYAIDVIMHLIGNDQTAAEAAESVSTLIDRCANDLREEIERYRKICIDNGAPERAKFTNPLITAVRISSPHDSRYLALLAALDELISVTEVLRIAAVFNVKQKEALLNFQYTARQRVMNIGSRIVGLANAAWKTVDKAGKKQEATEAGAVEPVEEGAARAATEPGAELLATPEEEITPPTAEEVTPPADREPAVEESEASETQHEEPKPAKTTRRRRAVA
jgi:hypothetical protein